MVCALGRMLPTLYHEACTYAQQAWFEKKLCISDQLLLLVRSDLRSLRG